MAERHIDIAIKDILISDDNDKEKLRKIASLYKVDDNLLDLFNEFWNLYLSFLWSKEIKISKKECLNIYRIKSNQTDPKQINIALEKFISQEKKKWTDIKYVFRPRRFLSSEIYWEFIPWHFNYKIDFNINGTSNWILKQKTYTCSYGKIHLLWDLCNCIS